MNRGGQPRQGCGQRRFGSEIAAEKALAKSRSLPGGSDDSRKVKRCGVRDCGGWHLMSPDAADTIPPKVRQMVNARDEWCAKCGAFDRLEQHHRRPKQMGGDSRDHTDCPCNLVRLCRKHHKWAHASRAAAEAEGYLLAAETVLPGSVSVARAAGDGGITSYPTCDGRWVSESPQTEAA